MQILWALIGLIIIVSGHETYIPNSKHPDHNDKCHLKSTDVFIEFNESHTPVGICQKFTCREDFVIRVNHCPRYLVPQNCEAIPTDLSKSFPDCCVKLRCINDDGEEVIRPTAW